MSHPSTIFNPRPRIQLIDLPTGQTCIIVDDAMINPDALVQLATH